MQKVCEIAKCRQALTTTFVKGNTISKHSPQFRSENVGEEQKHIGTEHYVNSGISLNFSDSNKLSFSTKKNFKTDSTELYDISYQYTNDCLTAGLVYRREFYEDNDIEKKNTLMFTIKFVPFTGVRAPVLSP